MKLYKIYGQVPTWELLDIKHSIEDMYKFVYSNYENNPTNFLVVERDTELDIEFPLVNIFSDDKYLKFKEEYDYEKVAVDKSIKLVK